jgi:hypothetical protein
MRLIYVIPILLFCGCGTSKMLSKIDTTKAPTAEFRDQYLKDSVLQSFQKEYDISIITGYDKTSYGAEYYTVALQKNKWYKINYRVKTAVIVGTLPYKLEKTLIEFKKGHSVLKVLVDNNFVEIPDSNDGCKPDEYGYDPKNRNGKICHSNDAATHIIILVTKKGYSFKQYYDVDRMNACCPGNKNREVFIKCWNAVTSVK